MLRKGRKTKNEEGELLHEQNKDQHLTVRAYWRAAPLRYEERKPLRPAKASKIPCVEFVIAVGRTNALVDVAVAVAVAVVLSSNDKVGMTVLAL